MDMAVRIYSNPVIRVYSSKETGLAKSNAEKNKICLIKFINNSSI